MAIIEIQDLCYTYPGAAQPTLDHLDLTVEPGDFLAIVGNNGCGKSTLCKVLNGLIPHFITGTFTGSVKVAGQGTLQSDVGDLARKVGYVYQDFENQTVRPTVLDDASYACLNYGMTDYEARVGIRPPEIFAMGRALDEQALCYTVPEFLRQFQGENAV